jgi:hypothetical protein
MAGIADLLHPVSSILSMFSKRKMKKEDYSNKYYIITELKFNCRYPLTYTTFEFMRVFS